jgi:hypothetical protein
MRRSGFALTVHETGDMDAVKAAQGVPTSMQSCHTARIGGYVIEGHVPIDDITRLIAEQPAATGLAVPGMPQSAPGMDEPGVPYTVLLFDSSGGTRIFAKH